PVCGDNGKTYSNGCMACASGEITAYKEGECDKMSQEEALEIAQNSECTEQGTLTDEITYNSITKTWWIDLTPNEPKAGCNPACVVGEETLTAEINWRCTGAIPR
ncbi:hypothetical protein JXA85_00405, partial [Candidatus Woesearchaeota archaeon]|nr:hypothetical protein [Candidatus Woesearchaeota archaeon]